jgi:hypothetical protein
LLDRLRSPIAVAGSSLRAARSQIAETAFHDFSQYVFALEPEVPSRGGEQALPPPMPFSAFVEQYQQLIYVVICAYLPEQVEGPDGISITRHLHASLSDQAIAIQWFALFRSYTAPRLYAFYSTAVFRATSPSDLPIFETFEAWLRQQINTLGGDAVWVLSEAPRWEQAANVVRSRTMLSLQLVEADFGVDESVSPYGFAPYPDDIVNFGLRLVYRQTWTPLGTQPGEIVRTLPLGPKQVERVSVKFARRSRVGKTFESSRSSETDTETTETTKDSSEVVAEASESLSWHVEAEASASNGFASGKVTAGASGETASASKDTKSRLNETMEKTASRMRSEVKVVVSTESETSFEESRSSEITNPNDEIAITYVYTRLQRQYEITTELSEVSSVVFVPNVLPDVVDAEWIRKHDWIIGKVLLDESFADDLAAVRRGTEGDPGGDPLASVGPGSSVVDPRIQSLMGSMAGTGSASESVPGLPNYSTLPGQLPDIFRAPQEAYERELQWVRARRERETERARRLERLRAHISSNILHYCRAIWSAEDPDARLLRYRSIRVPMRWEFVATGPAVNGEVPGRYEAQVVDPERDLARLADLINPAGPIGYAANYSVYYIKENPRWSSLNGALSHLRTPYYASRITVENGREDGPQITYVSLRSSLAASVTYRIEHTGGMLWPLSQGADGSWHQLTAPIPYEAGIPFEFDGLKVVIDTEGADVLEDDDYFVITISPDVTLEDPELRELRWGTPPPPRVEEAAFYTREVIAEMGALVPAVALALLSEAAQNPSWGEMRTSTRQLMRDTRHGFLMKREHTRRFLLETNNLLLDLDIGQTPALEEFKRVHRYLDALKAFHEADRATLENDRRAALIDANELGDPEIERVTVVTGEDTNLVALGDG